MFFVVLGCRKFIGVCGWFVCLFLRIPETFLWNPLGLMVELFVYLFLDLLFVCFWGFKKLSFEILWEFVRQLMVLVPNTIMCRGPDQRLRTWSSVGNFCWYNIRVKLFSVLQNTAERFLAIGYKMFCDAWAPFCLLQNEMRLVGLWVNWKKIISKLSWKTQRKSVIWGRAGLALLPWPWRNDLMESSPPFSGKVTFVKTTRS